MLAATRRPNRNHRYNMIRKHTLSLLQKAATSKQRPGQRTKQNKKDKISRIVCTMRSFQEYVSHDKMLNQVHIAYHERLSCTKYFVAQF